MAWEEALGAGVGGLYRMIGKPAVWESRQKERTRQKRLNVKFDRSLPELAFIRLAAEQGPQLIEYDDTVAAFRTVTGQCETKVMEHFVEETRLWAAQVAEKQAEPRRLFERCRERTASYQAATVKLASAEAFFQQAEVEADRLRDQAPKHIKSDSLKSFTCQ